MSSIWNRCARRLQTLFTPASRPVCRARVPRLEALEDRMLLTVFNGSERSPFNSSEVVHLDTYFPDGSHYTGSGVMIDSDHVLTAGHMVYMAAHGGWATEVDATPGMQGSSKPYGTATSTYLRSYQGWTQNGDFNYDLGMVTLNSPIGNQTGWIGIEAEPDSYWAQHPNENTAGYPGDLGGGNYQYHEYGQISNYDSYRLYTYLDTYGGQSGSPVWRFDGTNSYLDAIVSAEDLNHQAANMLVRITQDRFNDIETWLKEDAAKTTPSGTGRALVMPRSNNTPATPAPLTPPITPVIPVDPWPPVNTWPPVTPPTIHPTFSIGLDNQVYEHIVDDSGNSQGGYFLTTPGQVKSLSVSHDASGHALVFVIGLNDQVYEQKFDAYGDSISGFTLTAVGQVKSISVGQDALNNPLVFAIGLNDQVYEEKFDSAGNSTGGYNLTTVGQVKALDVNQDGNGKPLLFVIGLNDQVYEQRFDSAGNSTSGYLLTAGGQVKSLAVTRDAFNHPVVFVMGLDNQVYEQQFDAFGNSLGGYFLTTRGLVKSLSVTEGGGGQPLVLVIGLDNQVYEQQFNASGNSYGSYALTSAGQVKSLGGVAHGSSGALFIFVIGLNDQVYEQKLDASAHPMTSYFLTTGGQVKLSNAGK